MTVSSVRDWWSDRTSDSGDPFWLTSADVARMLGMTTRGVRWLARQRSGKRIDDGGELASVRTLSGQHLFRRSDVEQLMKKRAMRRLRWRQLAAVRPRMVRADIGPQQLRLHVTPAKGPLPHAEVKRA